MKEFENRNGPFNSAQPFGDFEYMERSQAVPTWLRQLQTRTKDFLPLYTFMLIRFAEFSLHRDIL